MNWNLAVRDSFQLPERKAPDTHGALKALLIRSVLAVKPLCDVNARRHGRMLLKKLGHPDVKIGRHQLSLTVQSIAWSYGIETHWNQNRTFIQGEL